MSIKFWHIAWAAVGVSAAAACAEGGGNFPPPKTADEYFSTIQGDSRVAPIRVFVLEPKIENDTDFVCVGMYDAEDVNVALKALNGPLVRSRPWRA